VSLGGILRLDCASLSYQRVNADIAGFSVVVMDTGVPRTLAGSKYSERVGEIEAICKELRLTSATLCRDFDAGTLAETASALPPLLGRRLRHIVSEHLRVQAAAECLHRSNLAVFGMLMNESHASLRDDYEVSGPALDAIVDASRSQPGVLGARMTGAGFGGCAIALVESAVVADHNQAVIRRYTEEMGQPPVLFEVTVDDGLRRLDQG
jgi:galactokinase